MRVTRKEAHPPPNDELWDGVEDGECDAWANGLSSSREHEQR